MFFRYFSRDSFKSTSGYFFRNLSKIYLNSSQNFFGDYFRNSNYDFFRYFFRGSFKKVLRDFIRVLGFLGRVLQKFLEKISFKKPTEFLYEILLSVSPAEILTRFLVFVITPVAPSEIYSGVPSKIHCFIYSSKFFCPEVLPQIAQRTSAIILKTKSLNKILNDCLRESLL